MQINHNLAALNTYNRLNAAQTNQSKSLEKLSSGQRINKAGDDAAGLAISEKMRSQIKGLDQAGRNAQDGISMIQTAEGALNETHSILQRMRELAVQGANDTNTAADRDQIQKEVNQLSSEINRIAGTTEFNKQKLLNGGLAADSVSGAKVQIQTAGKDEVKAVFEMTFNQFDDANTGGCLINVNVNGVATCITVTGQGCTLASRVAQIANAINACAAGACFTATSVGNKLILTSKADNSVDPIGINGCNIIQLCAAANSCVLANPLVQSVQGACATESTNYLTFTDDSIKEGTRIDIGQASYVLFDSSKSTYTNCDDMRTKLGLSACVVIWDIHACASVQKATDFMACLAACTNTSLTNFVTIGYDTTNKRICIQAICAGVASDQFAATKVYGLAGTNATSGNGTTLQIGANADQTFKAYFGNMTGTGINVTSTNAGKSITTSDGKVAYFSGQANVDKEGSTVEFSLDLSSAANATAAISAIDDSITAVSSERAKLGAYQNRLEHTINNLSTSSENLTAAESRIRDVDMAKEMMEFNKNNILNQAATAMLAQANQGPQGVLQLLR